MKGVIHFVDEDRRQVKPYVDTLRARGFEVNSLVRADDALDFLLTCDVGVLVVIDIMLARGDPERPEFTAAKTADSVETGLVLLELLCAGGAPLVPARAALFTHVERAATLRKAEGLANRLTIPLWKKSDFDSGFRFAVRVEEHLARLDRRSNPHK